MVQKGIIETTVKQVLDENELAGERKDLTELYEQLEFLQEKIAGYNIDAKIEQANAFLHENMNRICSKLDFEDDLQPVNLNFDLRDFTFWHNHDKENIGLSEMGSGANWWACHLSLFLSLLNLTCKEKNSSILNFLFLDQPSQVYFPHKFDPIDDENIKQVTNIFDVLIEEIEHIKKEYQCTPQVIVLEHADNLSVKTQDFDSYVIRRWYKEGDKLI